MMQLQSQHEAVTWLLVAQDAHRERPDPWWWRTVAGVGVHSYVDAHAYTYVYAYAYADVYSHARAHGAHAYADAFADARAHGFVAAAHAYADVDYADAHADAHAYANPEHPQTGHHMKPGLYLYATPSSDGTAVLRVAWLRRVPGEPDEYEALHSVTPLRDEYTTMLADAQDAPPKNWKWAAPLKRPSPLHRSQIRHPVALLESGYAKLCPRPEGWTE